MHLTPPSKSHCDTFPANALMNPSFFLIRINNKIISEISEQQVFQTDFLASMKKLYKVG